MYDYKPGESKPGKIKVKSRKDFTNLVSPIRKVDPEKVKLNNLMENFKTLGGVDASNVSIESYGPNHRTMFAARFI